ncbi:hypothetical protein D3C85_933220 [compost metagenome]
MGSTVASRVIDLHEFKLAPAPGRTQGKTTDAAETVNTYFDAHGVFSFVCVVPTGTTLPGRMWLLPQQHAAWRSGRSPI